MDVQDSNFFRILYVHNPDNHNGVITHLEPDILECEIKWALASITASKASGSDGIPVELFQILKDDAVKVLHSICQQTWKTPSSGHRIIWGYTNIKMEKVSFYSKPKERQSKQYSNYHTTALISHASKAMLKILQARLQQYMNRELPDVQAGFRKGRELDIKFPTSAGSPKKQESSRKTSISALLTMPKPLTV